MGNEVMDILAKRAAAKVAPVSTDPLLLERGMIEDSVNAIVRYRETGAEVVKAVRSYANEKDNSYFKARAFLAATIGEAFGVTGQWYPLSKEIMWYGFEDDVDMVEDLFDHLEPQMITAVLGFTSDQAFGSRGLVAQREDFAIDWSRVVGNRLQEFYRNVGNDADKAWRDREVANVTPRARGMAMGGGSAAGRAAGAQADILLGHKLAA
jgi:hypothetical protein